MTSVIVAGCRDFFDYNVVDKTLQSLPFEITEVVCGGASGADMLGKKWATSKNIPVKMFPALWEKYGKSAGIIRNTQMAKHAKAAVIFWDGISPGSKNMLTQAIQNRLNVVLIFV